MTYKYMKTYLELLDINKMQIKTMMRQVGYHEKIKQTITSIDKDVVIFELAYVSDRNVK